MSFDVPVLLITWRRPETTRQVLCALRQVSPSVVYVASDGPRNQIEATNVNATRELIDHEIDWPCKVSRLFSETNQGCEKGVSEAINWFFSSVEEGIILEDDCVPHIDFFDFCRNLLKRYKDDQRIWCISGNNFQNYLQSKLMLVGVPALRLNHTLEIILETYLELQQNHILAA